MAKSSVESLKSSVKNSVSGFFYLLLATCYLFPSSTFAQGTKIANPAMRYNTLNDFLLMLLDLFLVVMMPLMILLIIYGGYKIVASAGDEAAIKSGKSMVLWSLVGAAIILGARVIFYMVAGTWSLF